MYFSRVPKHYHSVPSADECRNNNFITATKSSFMMQKSNLKTSTYNNGIFPYFLPHSDSFRFVWFRILLSLIVPSSALLLFSFLACFFARLFFGYFCVLIWCLFSRNNKKSRLMCCCCCSLCSLYTSLIKWHYMSASKYIS